MEAEVEVTLRNDDIERRYADHYDTENLTN